MKCRFCGYDYRERVDHPRKCPRCGNPLGCKPQRRLWGRFTK